MANQLLLLLRLEGLMQSWGERARWDTRDTTAFPTKSGVVGLLACARGWPRGDEAIRQLEQQLTMGVRADRPGLLMTDFQTISGEIVTANGQSRGKKGEEATILSLRQYLFDAAFLVVLAGPEKTLESLAVALQNPVWQIYLGRKTCVPSRPVFEELTRDYPSLDDALRNTPLCERAKRDHAVVCEIEHTEGSYLRRDRPLVTPSRHYGMRRLNRFVIESIPGEVKL